MKRLGAVLVSVGLMAACGLPPEVLHHDAGGDRGLPRPDAPAADRPGLDGSAFPDVGDAAAPDVATDALLPDASPVGDRPTDPTDGTLDAPTGYAAVVLADHPVGYWRLGDPAATTAVDSSGSGHDGDYIGAVTVGVAGAIAGDPDTAASFDPSGAYVELQDHFGFEGTAPFSVEAWVNPTAIGGIKHIFTKQERANPKEGWALLVNDDGTVQLERYVADSSPGTAQSTATLTPGAFTHVVGVYDGQLLRIYVNAQLTNANTVDSRELGAHPVSAIIASASLGNENNFDGTLDEVAVYDQALGADRVMAHYQAGLGK